MCTYPKVRDVSRQGPIIPDGFQSYHVGCLFEFVDFFQAWRQIFAIYIKVFISIFLNNYSTFLATFSFLLPSVEFDKILFYGYSISHKWDWVFDQNAWESCTEKLSLAENFWRESLKESWQKSHIKADPRPSPRISLRGASPINGSKNRYFFSSLFDCICIQKYTC